MAYGNQKSKPQRQSRKVILVEASPQHGHATLTDPPEWFLVLTDPPPYVFVCSGSTKEEAIQRAEKLGYSFEENPEPFPVGHQL
ncbi:hypothetical protein [Xanthomonas sp. D-99]|uniref:hypothetical protein n=1 Tax=Xanthomonas sp. D-99 TaxID=2821273 RepID=UPI001ADA3A52|nr:hypothetical protein [Xanthomonas sp. D-99]MBO9876096.1 hypothetical protein [Xanthomonas sp. D-99]